MLKAHEKNTNSKLYNNEEIGITGEITELINQNAKLKNQIEKLRKDFELLKSTVEFLLKLNNSLLNLETQKLIDETFLKFDKKLNNIQPVNKFTNIEAYNNAISEKLLIKKNAFLKFLSFVYSDFEAFNYQQILKIINKLKRDLKSTEYYCCWIDEFVPEHKFLETISQVKGGLKEIRNRY
ncbi:16462_t:CDS:2 [Cetraspora pellucida]|uniref:16462_t:CDS:1 n=1 Tax=Cetraspora pellucida TaxID=1433469 RepID=A0ACA9K4G1_9GLOM|nr:16462_t:CDS:2 [Cetraspora pellucida]